MGDPLIDRILADNDPRNGSIAHRLIRMSGQPNRQPDADGLYPDAPSILAGLDPAGRAAYLAARQPDRLEVSEGDTRR